MTSLIVFLISFGYMLTSDVSAGQSVDTQGTEQVAPEQSPSGDFVVITDIGGA